jgi:hypothetical protein
MDTAECAWQGETGTPSLTIRLQSFTKDEQAGTALHHLQTQASGYPASGIGDEASSSYDGYHWPGPVSDPVTDQIEILFRRNKNVVTLDYEGPRTQQNCLQAAKWVDAALSRFGR